MSQAEHPYAETPQFRQAQEPLIKPHPYQLPSRGRKRVSGSDALPPTTVKGKHNIYGPRAPGDGPDA